MLNEAYCEQIGCEYQLFRPALVPASLGLLSPHFKKVLPHQDAAYYRLVTDSLVARDLLGPACCLPRLVGRSRLEGIGVHSDT